MKTLRFSLLHNQLRDASPCSNHNLTLRCDKADEFLTKPIENTVLFARVKSLTRMKAVIDELKLRSTTNPELGVPTIQIKDNFTDDKIGETINNFIERADKALYQAKNTGRNKVVHL